MSNYKVLDNESTKEDESIEEKSHRLLPNMNTSNMRIVTEQQCNAMKKNCLLLLKEHNIDEHRPLNRQEFIPAYKQMLPNSDDIEIRKLFDFIDGDNNNNTKTVSFHQLLNDPETFQKLLYSMGCIQSNQDLDGGTDSSYSDTEEEESPMPHIHNVNINDAQARTNNHQRASVRHNIPTVDENTVVPQLTWRQPISHTRNESVLSNVDFNGICGGTMRNVNMHNYTEYIKHLKEEIMELKHKINELNRYEIKCNELQLILDSKHKKIRNLKEEIKELRMDKEEYILEMNTWKEEWNELSQKYNDLESLKKRHESERSNTNDMLQQVDELKSGWSTYKAQSDALLEEKHKLDKVNKQFTEVNERLRNELEKERKTVQKLKASLNTTDEEIRSLTLESMSKDQKITALLIDIDDLSNQVNFHSQPLQSALPRDSFIADWGYASYEGTDAANLEMEFDIFQDLGTSMQPMPVLWSGGTVTVATDDTLRTPEMSTGSPGDAYKQYGYKEAVHAQNVIKNDIVIKLTKKKVNEDEKTHEYEEDDNAILLNRIHLIPKYTIVW